MPSENPVVLITGASRGLGRGIALHAAKIGCSVMINYVANRRAARETEKLCLENRVNAGQRFVSLQADIGSRKDRAKLLKASLKLFGRLDALVNNAGIGPRVRRDITETTEESFAEVMQANLQGAFFLTQSVANYWLREQTKPALAGGFKIIFISSISAESISLNRGEYCISKAGLSMASRLWAVRLADHGIQVFELRPGIMATDMTSAAKEKYDKQLSEGLVPLARWGTEDDVGQAVSSILAGHFPFSTGEVIYVDGGLHIPRL
jgi:NAD(P)-dependent dehydrogenase (short-subunit alcohol dehydrogenase family)